MIGSGANQYSGRSSRDGGEKVGSAVGGAVEPDVGAAGVAGPDEGRTLEEPASEVQADAKRNAPRTAEGQSSLVPVRVDMSATAASCPEPTFGRVQPAWFGQMPQDLH